MDLVGLHLKNQDHIVDGIDEKGARLGIFSNLSGGGFFSYKKAIEELESLRKDFPGEKSATLGYLS